MLGMLISVPILIYQIVIGSIIVGAGVLFGRTGAKWAAVLAALWTLTHIILVPLMCLQFVTIACATALSFALAGRRTPSADSPPDTPADAAGARRVDAEIRDVPDASSDATDRGTP